MSNTTRLKFVDERMPPAHERRMSTRYPIRGNVRFTWISEGGRHSAGSGATRNISVSGAFIESPEAPPRDAAVTVSAELLSGLNECLQTCLVGIGTVCRVEADEETGKGFAVAVAFHADGASAHGARCRN